MSLTVDIYARVSRASDDRQRSVKGQVDDCAARLADLGHRPGEVHVDNSRSAWNPRVSRPGWDALMDRLECGVADGVIVFDLARFSRRPIEGERLIAAAERGLLVLDSEDSYDLTTANGKKHFRDQMAGAAYESDRLSTRTRRGKRAKAARGEPNSSWRPFGFEPDSVTIREDEAATLREITDRFLAGESQDRIADDLNTRRITTSIGGKWNRVALRQVLTRHRNAGLVVYKGEVTGKLPGDPIIPIEQWERVCATFAARRTGRPPSDAYLCSGIATCGLCGSRLYGRPRASRKPYPDGAPAREYHCQKPKEGCGRLAIDQRGLDTHMAAFTITVLSDTRHAAAVEAAARQHADDARTLDETIIELEDLAGELAARLGRGEITLDRYDAATAPLDRRLKTLRAERAAIPAHNDATVDPAASREEWTARWETATTDEKRGLLRLTLRGRRLLIGPADRKNRTDVAGRVNITAA